MTDQISRRAILRGSVGAAVIAAASPLTAAQQATSTDAALDRRLEEAKKKLAKPLSPEARKIARTGLKNLEQEYADRLKTKLPENSEPCFTYIPTEKK